MGHKINPTGLRLGITQEHRSRWYASSKNYPALLQEDDRIRKFIHKKYGSAGISDVLIARKADQLEVELKTARPGVLVGRQGSGIEELPLRHSEDHRRLQSSGADQCCRGRTRRR